MPFQRVSCLLQGHYHPIHSKRTDSQKPARKLGAYCLSGDPDQLLRLPQGLELGHLVHNLSDPKTLTIFIAALASFSTPPNLPSPSKPSTAQRALRQILVALHCQSDAAAGWACRRTGTRAERSVNRHVRALYSPEGQSDDRHCLHHPRW